MAGYTAAQTIHVPMFVTRAWNALASWPYAEPKSRRDQQTDGNRGERRSHAVSHAAERAMVLRLQASMRIVEHDGSRIGVIPLAGELSMNTVAKMRPCLQAFIDEQELYGFIFDLAHVTQIDSAGIALLVELIQWCQQRQTAFACSRPSQSARNLMELTYVLPLLQVYMSVDEALTTLGDLPGDHENGKLAPTAYEFVAA